MNKHINFLLSVLTLPFLLYIIAISVYFSPCIQGINLEYDFKTYYLSYSKGKPDPTSDSQGRIQDIIDKIYRVRRGPDTSLEKAIWVGMLSGSENIALPSGAIHFSYLLKNNKTTTAYGLVFLCLLYTSLFLVGVSGIWHNVLTYILRLDVIPTRCYLRYVSQHLKNLSINNKKQNVPTKGYTKTLYAYLPYWLIGFVIGYINGDYHVYTQSPIIPIYLLVCASVYCVCIGSSLVLSINQIILFIFMRLNVDVVTKYVDDVICAGIAICISKWIFNNGIGTTIAVTLTTLLYTIIMNNRTRAASANDCGRSELSAIGYANLGFHYHKKRRLQKAIDMFKKSIDIYTDLDQINNAAPIYGSLGKAYFDNGNLDFAEHALKKALSIYVKRVNAQEAITYIERLLRIISERRHI